MQRSTTQSAGPAVAPPIVHEALRSSGHALDDKTRAFFEPRFGHDFSKVRVHADSQAAESAQAVNAFAYTVGQDIVFGAGQFAPGTAEGNRLLAHELTHTVQQSEAGTPSLSRAPITIGSADDSSEREANGIANALSTSSGLQAGGLGGSPSLSTTTGITLQRACSGNSASTCYGSCTTAGGRVGKCIFNSMPRWCKCLDTAWASVPAWLAVILGAGAIACFATGACEFAAAVAGLGTAAAAALIAIMRAAGFQDTGTTVAANSGSSGGSQASSGSQPTAVA